MPSYRVHHERAAEGARSNYCKASEKEVLVAKRKAKIVVGIDLAGSPPRLTGICVLRNLEARTHIVAFGDDEIVRWVRDAGPELVSIDDPLSLPPGRRTIHDRSGEHFRGCDRELRRRGIRFFPITLGPMRMLTERGIELKSRIERTGFRVVECYLGAIQDVWELPRQNKNREGLLAGLQDLGVRGLRGR